MTILDRIRELLRGAEVEFRELHHAPTRTSEPSAAGVPPFGEPILPFALNAEFTV